MKALIWTLCFFANGLILSVFQASGISLGALPTALLFIGTISLAKALCSKWDNR